MVWIDKALLYVKRKHRSLKAIEIILAILAMASTSPTVVKTLDKMVCFVILTCSLIIITVVCSMSSRLHEWVHKWPRYNWSMYETITYVLLMVCAMGSLVIQGVVVANFDFIWKDFNAEENTKFYRISVYASAAFLLTTYMALLVDTSVQVSVTTNYDRYYPVTGRAHFHHPTTQTAAQRRQSSFGTQDRRLSHERRHSIEMTPSLLEMERRMSNIERGRRDRRLSYGIEIHDNPDASSKHVDDEVTISKATEHSKSISAPTTDRSHVRRKDNKRESVYEEGPVQSTTDRTYPTRESRHGASAANKDITHTYKDSRVGSSSFAKRNSRKSSKRKRHHPLTCTDPLNLAVTGPIHIASDTIRHQIDDEGPSQL